MQITTVLGIIIGVCTLIFGMILKGSNPAALINPAALVIIFVGTTAALLNAFPMNQFSRIPKLFVLLFKGTKYMQKPEIARQFVYMSQIARKDGILALEKTNEETEDDFMRSSISMIIDGIEAEIVENTMESMISALQERHRTGAGLFSQAGTYAPTLGVLGAVIGLVAALGNLSDIEKLGHSIAAAFIATLFGIFTGYVLWHPFANKLKQMSRMEVESMRMIYEGVMALHSGLPPVVVQLKMAAFLDKDDKEVLYAEWGK